MTPEVPPRLFCFGLGYSALELARALKARGWRVAGTCRGEAKRKALAAEGIEAHLFDRGRPLADPAAVLEGAGYLLSSVPPDAAGDPVLDHHGGDIGGLGDILWVGYLSTTGVYGDSGGAWVDEATPPRPGAERGQRRLAAERDWLRLWQDAAVPVHLFRLAGIYGPGRSAFDRLRDGTAKRIDRPGHVFSRIHVEDIAGAVMASMERPDAGAVYNLCDDEPAEPQDVTAEAARLLGIAPPPLVSFEAAAREMSPMARSFWRDCRRVSNRRIKEELGYRFRHPDYRAGLRAILSAEKRT